MKQMLKRQMRELVTTEQVLSEIEKLERWIKIARFNQNVGLADCYEERVKLLKQRLERGAK